MENSCDFLQGVCMLQSAIEGYLKSVDFYNADLNEMIEASGGVKFVPYDAQPDETARTLVTMRRDTIALNPQNNMMSSSGTVAYYPVIPLILVISSQSYKLTEKLGQELLQLVAVLSKSAPLTFLNIGSLQLTPTANDNSNSPNYFICKVSMQCSMPLTMWKIDNSSDILTSVKLNTKFN